MASLELRNGQYRVVFRYGGQKFSQSLRTTDEKQALLSLARLEDNLRRLELGTLELPSSVDVSVFLLSDGRMVAHREASPIRTLARLTKAFLESIPEGSLEESTIKGMEIHIRHLHRILGRPFRLCDMSLDVLQRYVQVRRNDKGLRGKKVSPATIKKEIVTLNSIWIWANHMEYVKTQLPKKGLRFPKTDEKPPFRTWEEIEYQIKAGSLSESQAADLWDCLFLTLPEIKALLEDVKRLAKFDFIYPMIAFAAHTGARRSELMRSQITDIDLTRKQALIREKKRVRGKLSTRRVPISPFLAKVLEDWLSHGANGPHLFSFRPTPEEMNGSISPDQAHHHFKKRLNTQSGIRYAAGTFFGIRFVQTAQRKGSTNELSTLGWATKLKTMVRRYRHLIPHQQQEAIKVVFS